METEHDHDMHEPQSFWTKYIWSQDHKVIAIQYSLLPSRHQASHCHSRTNSQRKNFHRNLHREAF